MSIVEWDTEVKITGNAERDQELLVETLKTDVSRVKKWRGTVIKKPRMAHTFVELRRSFRGSDVLLVVANKGWKIQRRAKILLILRNTIYDLV